MAARHRRARHVDVRRADQPGQGAIAQDLRRLDRAHREGRSAAGAAAAEGHRAQPRRDAVGRRRRPLVHARRGLDRQEPSDGERRRTRSTRCRPATASSCAGSEREHDRRARHPDARAEGEGAVALPGAESSVAVLGQRASVGEPAVRPGRSAQPDARQQGPRVDDVEDPRQSGSVVVQRRDQQVRRVVPAAQQRPAGVVLRSEDASSSR